MGDLSERDVEDILGGVQPPGRDDLRPVVNLAAWMHASREIEPPPVMRDHLFEQIEGGLGSLEGSGRRSPAHMAGRPRAGARRLLPSAPRRSFARPAVSVAAAAALLVGVILAARSGDRDADPGTITSKPVAGVPDKGAEPAPTTASPTTPAAEPGARDGANGGSSATTAPAGETNAPATAPSRGGSASAPPAPADSTSAPTRPSPGTAAAAPSTDQPAPGHAGGVGGGASAGNHDPGGEPTDRADGEQEPGDDRADRHPSSTSSDDTSDEVDGSWWPWFDLSFWHAPGEVWAPSGAGDAADSSDR